MYIKHKYEYYGTVLTLRCLSVFTVSSAPTADTQMVRLTSFGETQAKKVLERKQMSSK